MGLSWNFDLDDELLELENKENKDTETLKRIEELKVKINLRDTRMKEVLRDY